MKTLVVKTLVVRAFGMMIALTSRWGHCTVAFPQEYYKFASMVHGSQARYVKIMCSDRSSYAIIANLKLKSSCKPRACLAVFAEDHLYLMPQMGIYRHLRLLPVTDNNTHLNRLT